MTYAVVEISGKQFKVEQGSKLTVDKIKGSVGDSVTFDKVLMQVDGDDLKVGTPYLEGAAVTAEIIDQTKDKKIRVAKYKSKSRYRRVYGHRQHVSKLTITSLTGKAKKTASNKKASKPAAKKSAKKSAKSSK